MCHSRMLNCLYLWIVFHNKHHILYILMHETTTFYLTHVMISGFLCERNHILELCSDASKPFCSVQLWIRLMKRDKTLRIWVSNERVRGQIFVLQHCAQSINGSHLEVMLRSVMLYNIRGRLGDFCFMFQEAVKVENRCSKKSLWSLLLKLCWSQFEWKLHTLLKAKNR
jgi:hypothetical protein